MLCVQRSSKAWGSIQWTYIFAQKFARKLARDKIVRLAGRGRLMLTGTTCLSFGPKSCPKTCPIFFMSIELTPNVRLRPNMQYNSVKSGKFFRKCTSSADFIPAASKLDEVRCCLPHLCAQKLRHDLIGASHRCVRRDA